ncbi:MAG: 1-acyl-sn-glycerol-3-phosphate acyltransferase [Deltaproteobacteria bacterium]|nr:1-acyl-sn-glycerol-3-phosphate acyltransferase [Deltaproteobacteria bacterium]
MSFESSVDRKEEATGISARIRAAKRFILTILITGFSASIYFLLTLFYGYNRERFERHTKRWAKELINLLNIKVEFEGDIPHIAYLIVANHRSYIDIPVLYTILPGVFLAKKEVSRWPVLGFAARAAGTIFVERESLKSRAKARETILKRIHNGEKIYIFPEGTTSPGPKLLEFKSGIFKTASENFLPILPVAIQYSDIRDAWLGNDTFIGHFFRTFSKKAIFVKVTFCKPLSGTDAQVLRDRTHKSISDNLPDFYEVSCAFESPT